MEALWKLLVGESREIRIKPKANVPNPNSKANKGDGAKGKGNQGEKGNNSKGYASNKGKGVQDKGKGKGDTKGNGKADIQAPPAQPPVQRKLQCWTRGEEHKKSECPKLTADGRTPHPKAKAKTKSEKAKLKQAQTETSLGVEAPSLQVVQAVVEKSLEGVFSKLLSDDLDVRSKAIVIGK